MNNYVSGSMVSLVLLSLGIIAASLGVYNYSENKKSESGRGMLWVFVSVFFWTFGYAWMGMCYNSDFAYVARAIALLAVNFYIFFIIRHHCLLFFTIKNYVTLPI